MSHRKRNLLLFLLSLIPGLISGQDLTPEQKRGQHLYRTGTTPTGDNIPTFLGNSKTPIPSHLFACTNCHGQNGQGVPEGGVKPSNITWHSLTKPYGAISGTHRDRPPYNEQQILTAIREGKDPLGSRLEPSMPRYQLSQGDEKALISYLKIIHRVQDPGVSAHTLRLGLIIPRDPKYQIIPESLRAYFNLVNQEGGIYRRKVKLLTLTLSETPGQWTKEWADFLAHQEPFVLLAPVMAHHDLEAIGQLIEKNGIPVIAPFLRNPRPLEVPNPYLFYFYPGLDLQLLALQEYAREHLPPVATLRSPTLKQLAQLKSTHTRSLVLLEQSLPQTLAHLTKLNWTPTLLLPRSRATPEAGQYPGDLYFAYPHQSPRSPADPKALQKSALIAADVLRTLLLKTGRKVTRKAVIELLESFHQRETRWTAPLTFSPNQRVGTSGAYVGPPAKTWDPATPWIQVKARPKTEPPSPAGNEILPRVTTQPSRQ